jgi:hypothetical protein
VGVVDLEREAAARREAHRPRLPVLGPGDVAINNWHYRLAPAGDGTDVTESFRLNSSALTKVFWMFAGHLRGRRNVRDMRTTLERIKKVVEEKS